MVVVAVVVTVTVVGPCDREDMKSVFVSRLIGKFRAYLSRRTHISESRLITAQQHQICTEFRDLTAGITTRRHCPKLGVVHDVTPLGNLGSSSCYLNLSGVTPLPRNAGLLTGDEDKRAHHVHVHC